MTVNLHNITLRSALRLMLKNLQLTYIIQDEVLMITTPEEAEKQLVVKVYPVADLVLPIDSSILGGIGGGGGGIGGGQQGGGGGGSAAAVKAAAAAASVAAAAAVAVAGGGGGGGLFSVPDDADASRKSSTSRPAGSGGQRRSRRFRSAAAKAIAIDKSLSPDEFWNAYFSREAADPAAVRETVRQLMGKKQFDQVIALIHAALRNGQPQSWMYESLGIAMELDGRSKTEIERAVMSAADFSTSADELMYIAQYLSRLGSIGGRCCSISKWSKIEPLRSEAYALGLRAAERCDDMAGIRWATVGILSQAWPNEHGGDRS